MHTQCYAGGTNILILQTEKLKLERVGHLLEGRRVRSGRGVVLSFWLFLETMTVNTTGSVWAEVLDFAAGDASMLGFKSFDQLSTILSLEVWA